MADLKFKDFYEGTLPTTEAELVALAAAPSDGTAHAVTFTIANNNAAAVAVKILAGTAGSEKSLLPTDFVIPANDAYVHPRMEYIAGGKRIRGVSDTDSVDIRISGLEAS